MTGRIERQLNDIKAGVTTLVDRWMQTNYNETITWMPRALFREEILAKAMAIMVKSGSDEVSKNIYAVFSGRRGLDGAEQVVGNTMSFANAISAEYSEKLRKIEATTDPDWFHTVQREVSEQAELLGIMMGKPEIQLVAAEFILSGLNMNSDLRQIRTTMDSRYASCRDLQGINLLMNAIGTVGEARFTAFARKMAHFVVGQINNLPPTTRTPLLNKFSNHAMSIVSVGVYLVNLSIRGKEVPYLMDLYDIALTYMHELANAIVHEFYIPAAVEIFDNALAKKEPQVQQNNLAQLVGMRPSMAHQTMQHDTVTKIGQQIQTMYNDAALPYTADQLSAAVGVCMNLGITCRRGVECIGKAFAPRSNVESNRILVAEAVIWQYSGGQSCMFPIILPNDKDGVESLARAMASKMTNADAYGHDLHLDGMLRLIDQVVNNPMHGEVQPQPVVTVNMLPLEESFYRSLRNDDELVVSREYGLHPISEMPMQGAWVLRNFHTGEFIDSDKYINDLFERNNLKEI